MKKIVVLGTGAQGSTVAKRLDEESAVGEIICADYDIKAAEYLANQLTKGTAVKVDAKDINNIAKIAEGADLMVNALPANMAKNALEGALKAGVNYQDFCIGLLTGRDDETISEYIEGLKALRGEYHNRFKDIGKLAIVGTGSAPGFMCVTARKAVNYLDTCDTIYIIVYEGIESKRFMPFWWSPETALSDMSGQAVAFINSEFVETDGFSDPIRRNYPEMNGKEITAVEHWHDEPCLIGMNSKTHFKGVKNVYFKYGGVGIDFALPLKRAGLLSHKEIDVRGRKVIPFETILEHLPPAPKYYDEIKEIIEEGIVSDLGAAVVECYGIKDGKNILVEAHVSSPGIIEAFEKSGLTGETYFTGQGGFLFTKLFVNDQLNHEGLITSDMLSDEENELYLKYAEDLDITVKFDQKTL